MNRVEVKEDCDLITQNKQLFYLPAKKMWIPFYRIMRINKKSPGDRQGVCYWWICGRDKGILQCDDEHSANLQTRCRSMLKFLHITLVHHIPGVWNTTTTKIVCMNWSDVGLCTSGLEEPCFVTELSSWFPKIPGEEFCNFVQCQRLRSGPSWVPPESCVRRLLTLVFGSL